MKRISTLVRRNVLVLALVAFGSAMLAPETANAQQPPLKVSTQIFKHKVNSNTYKVKLRITAEVPGIAKNTFETNWMYLTKNDPKPFELKFNLGFRMYGSLRWTGSHINASVNVEAVFGAMKLKRTVSASVAAS